MASRFKDNFARQLSLPTKGFMGWITTQYMKSRNAQLEKNAARLCNIQPEHNVLEIGFGPGIGIQHAVQYVKDGPGKICGIDLSSYMVETAASRLRHQIQKKKVHLCYGTVLDMPYATNTFDRVFHCNSYYFWSSMQQALQEIYRVMKPNTVMVTVLSLENLRSSQSRGLLKYGKLDLLNYMCALELTGFKEVKVEYFIEKNLNYQAVFAHLPEKPELHYDIPAEEKSSSSVHDVHDKRSATNGIS